MLQPGGLHPITAWDELTSLTRERYNNFAERIQWPARRSMCHGIHYHVGVASGDASVAIANSLAIQLPLFIACRHRARFGMVERRSGLVAHEGL